MPVCKCRVFSTPSNYTNDDLTSCHCFIKRAICQRCIDLNTYETSIPQRYGSVIQWKCQNGQLQVLPSQWNTAAIVISIEECFKSSQIQSNHLKSLLHCISRPCILNQFLFWKELYQFLSIVLHKRLIAGFYDNDNSKHLDAVCSITCFVDTSSLSYFAITEQIVFG